MHVLNDTAAIPTESVDLIYLDPPFNSKGHYNLPFKNADISAKPVSAFTDTWKWGEHQDAVFRKFEEHHSTQPIAQIIDVARKIEGPAIKLRLDAYLVNMAERLLAMRRVIKPSGSIYLHCDQVASHYLKAIMDVIFGKDNFRNDIIWSYGLGGSSKRYYSRKHDNILFYAMGDSYTFEKPLVPATSQRMKGMMKGATDVWPIPSLNNMSKERLGYPTQKPLELLERIVLASTMEGHLVLDPFCGCGTTLQAAEKHDRRWIGIDVARFSVGLVKNRQLRNFKDQISHKDIRVLGIPETLEQARELANTDKFEFEKWVCGHIGAEGMFHQPGTKGPDGGVDGVVKFFPLHESIKEHYAIVQVKGGNVTPDSVKALETTVNRYEAAAGIIVCFENQMKTVENNRSKETFTDLTNRKYPFIQGLSIEEMLSDGKTPFLPNLMRMVDDKFAPMEGAAPATLI